MTWTGGILWICDSVSFALNWDRRILFFSICYGTWVCFLRALYHIACFILILSKHDHIFSAYTYLSTPYFVGGLRSRLESGALGLDAESGA